MSAPIPSPNPACVEDTRVDGGSSASFPADGPSNASTADHEAPATTPDTDVQRFYDAVLGYSFPEGREVVVRVHESGWDVYDPAKWPSAGERVERMREALEPFAALADEWDRWQAKGSTSTSAMIRLGYGRCRIGLPEFQSARAALTDPMGGVTETGVGK